MGGWFAAQGTQSVLFDRQEGWDGVGNGREETYIYLRLIPAGVWQKPTQCYRAVILQ